MKTVMTAWTGRCTSVLVAAVLFSSVSSCHSRPVRSSPVLDVYLSAGDSWWVGTWLPVDSPGSIRASVQLWADVFKIRRIYWRGQQEEMMIDHGVIRKENLQFYQFFEQWERYLMKEEKVNQVLLEEAHKRDIEVFLWSPLFDFGGPAESGYLEYPYFGQINLTLEHPEWMPVDRYGMRRQNGPIEFAYPEARKAVIDIYMQYILRDKLDGIV